MKIIKVKEIIRSSSASSPNKAKPFLEVIINAIKNKEKIEIDFSGLKVLTTSFLNSSIGELYSLYPRNVLNEYIIILSNTLTSFQFKKVKMVMDNTRKKLLSQKEIRDEL